MDVPSTYDAAPPPAAIALPSNNGILSDWDSDSSGGIVVQSKLAAGSKAVSAGVAATMGPRPPDLFDSISGHANTVGIPLQATNQEARKWWEDEDDDDDVDENGQLFEGDDKNPTKADPFVYDGELNSSAKDTTGGGLGNDNEKSVTNRGFVYSSKTISERSKHVAEVNEIDILTPSQDATHRRPIANLSRTDDLTTSVLERKPESFQKDRGVATIGFRSRKDNREKAAKDVEMQLTNRNLIQQLDGESKTSSAGQLRSSQYVRMNPSGTSSRDEHSPTRLKIVENTGSNNEPRLVANSDTSDEDDDRGVRGSSNNDNHLLHGKEINHRDTIAADFTKHVQKQQTYCSSSDDEPPPTDGIVFKFFQVRRKYVAADLPVTVAEGAVARMRGRWQQAVAEVWREFFAAVGLVVSIPLLFVVELFHFVFRDIFYEVVCQLVVIFAAYFVKPLVTVVLFNAIVQPLGAFLWNLLHTFRRTVQPLVCILRDISLISANILQSFRLVEVFRKNSADVQSRRERLRSTTGVIQLV